jgi:glutathione S-transferase
MPHPIRLYRHPLSGHAHRAELMLSLLGLPTEPIGIDFATAEHKAPSFLARNAFGQLPVIEDGGFVLADSNAILVYLALTYDAERRWLPVDARVQAQIQRWLSVAAGQLANGPAAARVSAVFGRQSNPQHAATARQLFDVMEGHLADRDWLAADHATLADVAMYTYTAHAPEGGIALGPWPRLCAWVARVEALPRFVGMQRSPLPAAA